MKRAARIGLATATALALIAMLSAASASASALTETVLCKEKTQAPYCKPGDRYPKGTSFSASPGFPAETVTIGGPVEISCTESTISGTTGAEAGEPLPLTISAWTLGGCVRVSSGKPCTVTALERAPYSGSLNRTSGSNGTMGIGSGGKGKPGWTVKCGIFINCTMAIEPGFSYSGLPGHAEATVEKLPLERISGLCPEELWFSGTYVFNSPVPARLAVPKEAPSELATALCKSNDNYYCEAADRYAKGTLLLQDELTNLVFKNPESYGLGNFNCEKGTLQAETTAEYGNPLPVKLELALLYKCTTQYPKVSCSMSTTNPGSGGIETLGAPVFYGNGQWSGFDMTLNIFCGSISMTCKLSPVEKEATLVPGESGKLEGAALEWTSTGTLCPASTQLELAELPLALSGPLVVTDALR